MIFVKQIRSKTSNQISNRKFTKEPKSRHLKPSPLETPKEFAFSNASQPFSDSQILGGRGAFLQNKAK